MTKEERIQELRKEIREIFSQPIRIDLLGARGIKKMQDSRIDQILALIQKETYLKAERELPEEYNLHGSIVADQMLTPDTEGRVFKSVYDSWE